MHSTVKAKQHINAIGDLLAPEMPAKVRYSKIFAKLVDLLPGLTMRRVRSLHNGEAHRVDYEEVVALEELRAIEEARNEHRHFVAYTNKLAALHATGVSPVSGEEMAVLSSVASRPPVFQSPANSNARASNGRMDRARAA